MSCLLLAALSCVAGFDGPVSAPTPDATYEKMRAEAGRDAEAQVKLALWCEAHGLEKERLRHLAVATMADPSNALARGLMGLVEYNGKWKRPEAVARDLKADMARADLLAEYNGRRVKAAVTVAAQHKLALWCEEKGLKDEARAHLATVVRLDPNHADAWKRLGYKKVGNHWTTDAQSVAVKTEHTAQQEADKRWKSRLEHLRDALSHKGVKKDEAERELATLTDPRAVPMVWKVFVQGHEKHHLAAVQLLGQIDAASASRALATLALMGKSDEVRRRATETLKRRDPREYADLLIVQLRDKIKYEVRKVGGPGSPGTLSIEGKEQNLKRFYSPPCPNGAILPGDTIDYDAYGQPVLVHHNYQSGSIYMGQFLLANPGPSVPPGSTANSAAAQRLTARLSAGMPTNSAAQQDLTFLVNSYAQPQQQPLFRPVTAADLTPEARERAMRTTGPRTWADVTQSFRADQQVRVPVGSINAEAQRVAASAQDQLNRDVASLEAANRNIASSNAFITAVLKAATGASLPPEPEPWQKWLVDQLGYRLSLTTSDDKPTVVEDVPLDVTPQPIPVTTATNLATFSNAFISRHSCFGKGTIVRTLDGSSSIETLRVGDIVLSQDILTGKLDYRPVLKVHHNPPCATFRVSLGDDAIVTSPSHRFWVAGRGWVMARDLKVGDPIRTVGDITRVTTIEPEKVQPVFNLDIADDADFFVGSVGALVHDNTLPDLRLAPFDLPSVAAVK